MSVTSLSRQTRVLKGEKSSLAPTQERQSRLWRVALMVLLAVIAQVTVAPYLTVLGAKPDISLVVIVCLAMMRGPLWGAVGGFAAGMLMDIALVQTLGISSFLMTLAGYFSGRYAEGVDENSWFPPVLMVFVSTIFVQALNAVIMFLFGIEASVNYVAFRIILPSAILNALLAAPLFVVCRWWLKVGYSQSVFTAK